MSDSRAIRRHLQAVADGPGLYLDQPEAIEPYAVDWTRKFRGPCPLVVRPRTVEEVSRLLAACTRHGIAVVPQGGNTGLVGGSVPRRGEVVLSLSRMNAIGAYDEASGTIEVEAGVVLESLQNALERRGRSFAVDLGARGSCQIGGMIATNAGGIKVVRYGSMREQLRGLEAVLADGTVVSHLNRLRKDNTGIDLKQLFVGSEGILGVITRAILETQPLPGERETALLGVSDAARLGALAALFRERLIGLSSLEFLMAEAAEIVLGQRRDIRDPFASRHDAYVLVESELPAGAHGREAVLAVLGAALEGGVAADALVAESEEQRRSFWALREGIAEAIGHRGLTHKFDVTVPPGRIAEFMAALRAGLVPCRSADPVLFGHLGDGNVHVNLVQGKGVGEDAFRAAESALARTVYGLVVEFSGSISAEHGIGILKRDHLHLSRTPEEIALLRRMKAALDPRGILNPGVMVAA